MANPPDLNPAVGASSVIASGFPGAIVANETIIAKAATVEAERQDLRAMFDRYNLIEDCITGETAVKAKGDVYLPRPNAADISAENQARYNAYKTRAVFYNVAESTLAGLIGQVFLVDPEIKVPTLLDPVVKDANGNGVPLVQQMQWVEETVLKHGRAGLFTDYPEVQGDISLDDQQSGRVRPTLCAYAPWNVINWRTITRNGKVLLSLVVIREWYEDSDNGFAVDVKIQFRVLRLLADAVYVQELWRGEPGNWSIYKTIQPRDAKRKPLNEIPFTFVGAVDNSPSIDRPPLYALCSLNIGHYRNSADYEEAVFITGQATPVLTGLTKQWVDEVLKGTVTLGSRGAIPLPVGADAKLLQMEERNAAFTAMEHKERQMKALGAKLVEEKAVQRTATEARQDKASEDSILTTITKNVSAAFKFALEWAGIYAGTTTVVGDANNDTIVCKLNTEFSILAMSSDDINTRIDAWEKGAISWTEMRSGLDKAGLTTLDAEIAKREIEADELKAAEQAMKFATPEGEFVDAE